MTYYVETRLVAERRNSRRNCANKVTHEFFSCVTLLLFDFKKRERQSHLTPPSLTSGSDTPRSVKLSGDHSFWFR